MPIGARSLDELREEIDRIDRSIHELLIERTRVVHEVGRAKGNAPQAGTRTQFFRPGREAQVLRRLVERHDGHFPQRSLVQIWREIMSGQLRVQTEVTVAVLSPRGRDSIWDIARNQYGAAARYRAFKEANQVVAAVHTGDASIGVLPLPGAEDDDEPWWPLLADENPDTPRILARLPFIGSSAEPAALTIGYGQPDPSDRDRGYLAVESAERPVAVRALLDRAGIAASFVAEAAGGRLKLFETDGLLLSGDRRLDALRSGGSLTRIVSIGGYAVPILSDQNVRIEVA